MKLWIATHVPSFLQASAFSWWRCLSLAVNFDLSLLELCQFGWEHTQIGQTCTQTAWTGLGPSGAISVDQPHDFQRVDMMQEWRGPNDPDYRCDGELWQFKGTVRVLCCHVSTTKLEKFMLFQPDDVTCSCGTFYLIFDFLANNFDFFLIIFNFLIQQFGLFVSYLWLSISWFDLSIYLSICYCIFVRGILSTHAHCMSVCKCDPSFAFDFLHSSIVNIQSSCNQTEPDVVSDGFSQSLATDSGSGKSRTHGHTWSTRYKVVEVLYVSVNEIDWTLNVAPCPFLPCTEVNRSPVCDWASC